MCGIAGLVGLRPVAAAAVERMNALQAHRGPDDEGLWSGADGRVVLGHRRLAILDPTARGHQPMTDPTGAVALTFNGEIYNYLELADRLRAEGVRFETGTDTEVLLKGYLHWGEAVLDELNGMFAFALYDGRTRRLLCARDRFAEKPFLFAVGDGFFAFASEYKALLALAEVAPEVDAARVLGFLRDPRAALDGGRETAFHAIRQLAGGERLVLDIDGLDLDIGRYWSPAPDPELARLGDAEAQARFRALLTDSVRIRMRSDVELGSCLSGGLDSSTIVCLARELIGDHRPYHVFCGRFPGTPADEWDYAEQVVGATGVVPHVAEPDAEGLLATLADFAWYNELPVASTSQYAQWCVFRSAAENGVTVLLDGQGGDELLGGYEQYFAAYLAALRARGEGARAAEEADRIRRRYPLALPTRRQSASIRLPDPLRRGLARMTGQGSDFGFGVAAPFVSPAFPAPPIHGGFDALTGTLAEDSFAGSLTALLRYGDRNSMAHSREVRLPFCDHRLAALVLSLPPALLMGDAETKRLLRRGLAGVLPEAIATRWNKQGFLPPQAAWLRGALGEAVREVLRDRAFRERGWWRPGWWDAVLRRFEGGEDHLADVLWKPFIAEAWLRHFVDRVGGQDRASVFAEGVA